jgi:SPP1 gp7 family putative phage head morphogenesis protein
MLAAWLAGGNRIAGRLAVPDRPPGQPPIPPFTMPAPDDSDGGPVVSYPQVDIAAQSLAERQVLTRGAFDALSEEAKLTAFTVARVCSLDALQQLQEALSTDIAQGGTLADFQARVADVLGESALSPAHIENVYRTNVASAYADGQREVLNHPLVADEFPYVEYTAVHDSRTDPDHLAMEHHGIGGGPIYRRDDPVIQLFWPPWRYNCRCAVIALTLEDAAAAGVHEAQEWLRMGQEPASPAFVKMPDFQPPAGFGNRGRPLPVRMSWALSAARAPKGGVTISGKRYEGGEFVPAEVVANASPEEKKQFNPQDVANAHATAHYKEWLDKISDQDFETLVNYGAMGFTVNNDLRAAQGDLSKVKSARGMIGKIDRLMGDSPGLATPAKLYRGISQKAVESLTEGAEFTEFGYGSASFGEEYASTHGDAMLIIDAPKGQKGIAMNHQSLSLGGLEEQEFVFPRNTKFKVTEVGTLNGKRCVRMAPV